MTRKVLECGDTFARLTVVDRHEARRSHWNCTCECGKSVIVRSDHLRNGATRSCGCLHDELKTVHGMSGTPEYICWQHMIERCTNPKNSSYKDYGARGISVSDSWRSFQNFFKDMGLKPSAGLSIERIDNNSGYSKENCKWATDIEQVRNRRNSLLHTISGQTLCMKEWCVILGVSYSTARARVKRGLSVAEALGVD